MAGEGEALAAGARSPVAQASEPTIAVATIKVAWREDGFLECERATAAFRAIGRAMSRSAALYASGKDLLALMTAARILL